MKAVFLWIISLLVSFFGTSIFFQPWNLVNWINVIFIIGLLILLLGCILLVVAGEFFTAFLYSCKVFFTAISKKEQVIQELEGKIPYKSSFEKRFPSSINLIKFGMSYCLLSLLLSIWITTN